MFHTTTAMSKATARLLLLLVAIITTTTTTTAAEKKSVYSHERLRDVCSRSAGDDPVGGDPSSASRRRRRYDPLACWLWNMRVTIPDERYKKMIFSVAVTDVVCTGFSLGSIQSKRSVVRGGGGDGGNHSDPFLDVSAANASVSCRGKYAATGVAGDLSLTASSSSDVPLRLRLVFVDSRDAGPLRAVAARVGSCAGNLAAAATFSGSLSARVVNLFSSMISRSISKQLSSRICGLIRPDLETFLTEGVRAANEYASGLAERRRRGDRDAERPRSAKDAVTWREDLPLVATVLNATSTFVANHVGGSSSRGGSRRCPDGGGLVDRLTNGAGAVEILAPGQPPHRLHFSVPGHGNVSVAVSSATVRGVDGLDVVDALRPTGERSVVGAVRARGGLNVTTRIALTVDNGAGAPLRESFDLTVATSRAEARAVVDAYAGRARFDRATVGDAPRLLDAVVVSDASLVARVDAIDARPTNDDDATESELDATIRDAARLFLDAYEGFVTDALDGLVFGPARDAINERLRAWSRRARPARCSLARGDDDDGRRATTNRSFVRFDESVDFEVFETYVNDALTPDAINGFLACSSSSSTTNNTTTATAAGPPFLRFEREGFAVALRDLRLSNMGHFRNVSLLKPEIDHYHLMNTARFDKRSNDSDDSVVAFAADVSHPDLGLRGTVRLSFVVDDLALDVGALVRYDVGRLSALPLSSLARRAACHLAPLSALELYDVGGALSVRRVAVDVEASVGTVRRWSQSLSFEGAALSGALAERASRIRDATLDVVGTVVPEALYRAPYACAGERVPRRDDDDDDDSRDAGAGVRLARLLGAVGAACALAGAALRRRVDERPTEAGDEETSPLWTASAPKDRTSLVTDPSVPRSARQIVPVCVVCAIALFVSSNASVGASADLRLVAASGAEKHVPSLFVFGLGNTVSDMWSAKVYALATLVAFFSGAWPYVKLVGIGAAWCAPTNVLSESARGRLLEWLDALGKYSLVDAYVLVLLMVAFRLRVPLLGALDVDVYVTPKYGFYSFLVATVASLVLGHVVLFAHRRSASRRAPPVVVAVPSARPTPSLRRLLLGGTVVAAVSLVVGVRAESFRFEIGGLVGTLLDDDARVRRYSVMSLGAALPRDAWFVRTAFYLFAAVLPAASTLAWGALVGVPLAPTPRRRLLVAAEILSAWSAVDVFLLSALAAGRQLPRFADFVVGDRCDVLDAVVRRAFPELGDDAARCFSVKASSDPGAAWLLLAVASTAVVAHLTSRLTRRSLGEDDAILETLRRLPRAGAALVVVDDDDDADGYARLDNDDDDDEEITFFRPDARRETENENEMALRERDARRDDDDDDEEEITFSRPDDDDEPSSAFEAETAVGTRTTTTAADPDDDDLAEEKEETPSNAALVDDRSNISPLSEPAPSSSPPRA